MQVAREWKLWTHRAEILSHGDLTKKRRQEREQAAQAAKNYTGLAAVLEKEGDCAQGQISPRSPLDLPSISPRSSLDLPSIYPRSPLDLPSISPGGGGAAHEVLRLAPAAPGTWQLWRPPLLLIQPQGTPL